MNGVLVVDKPAGKSSAAVVAAVKRALGVRRVGHTGTLDPMATGVLPICLGEATKIAGHLLAEDKAYEGELELGVETDTLDAEGNVTRRAEVAAGRDDLERALAALVGDGTQIPPMHSALKREGVRLYALARAGVEIDRPARPIRVQRFELLAFEPPRARFRVECSKGTYVRALVRDVGAALGCGAHLTALRRVRSGSFSIATAVPLAEVSPETAAARLIDPADALCHLPGHRVPEAQVRAVRDGKRLRWPELLPGIPEPSNEFRLLTPRGALLALACLEGGRVRYIRVFTYGLTPEPD